MSEPTICPVCGCTAFTQASVLWPELVTEWNLQQHERDYTDEQQGFTCNACGASLRAMTLARAIMSAFHFQGLLRDWVSNRALPILEINEAQRLTPFLSKINGHVLAQYPEVDMCRLPYPDRRFDLVLHSDTLEHIADPVLALRECRRVLKPGGYLAYTIPIITGRMSRSRDGLPPSYHGAPGSNSADFLVHTEFGADFWDYTVRAGFNHVEIVTIRYPASVAVLASDLSAHSVFVPASSPVPKRRSWFSLRKTTA